MGSKERMQRCKDKVYNGILNAAMDILKTEGCESLSVRKIAEKIEYSVPVIYSYFLNKEAVLIELSRRGFATLVNCVEKALIGLTDPEARMESMLTAHIRFAQKESELYQLMYTVGIHVTDVEETFPILKDISNLFRKELNGLRKDISVTESSFRSNYLTFLSIAHGLATLNLYFRNLDPVANCTVLKRAVRGIISSIDFE
ncbi:TetR/AcrR family transcriptional regulator [Mucilaginibacter jinjuensis]|uniref:TetR/AcrR family transcriptional regulator n=1 Tax=Mucilaginibacter jinjuensis TaxID=1176721 RepID=A0ABY7TCM5_9SPHI|nr:TetR/AcrR family transcriptional regulator [Mucilaginibacter jinjuensis]WCT14088.1 TetR/AcrR family transcriptional regulator [Mucilaginibacter jinjuensis]